MILIEDALVGIRNAINRLAAAEEKRNALLDIQTAAQRDQYEKQKIHDDFVRRTLEGSSGGTGGATAPIEQCYSLPRDFPALALAAEQRDAAWAKIEKLEMIEAKLNAAIRYHLYVCPLPARNLRESIGYLADVQLAAPTDLPHQSLRDMDITSEANDPCICGHRKSDHNHPSKFPCHVCQCSKFDLAEAL